MLQDNIILNLVEETDIVVDEIVVGDIITDLSPNASVLVNVDFDVLVVIDPESIGAEVNDPFSKNGKIQRIFVFVKSVLGKKTTFGKVSFDIHDNIQTIGTADIDPGNHNIVAFPIVFGKAVVAQRTTFGQVSFDIHDNIQTAGINAIGGIRFYGSGLYGDGPYGTYYTAAILLPIRFNSAISGNIPYKQTSVAEISLASYGTPVSDENHSIKVRARTLSGSSGVLKVALYEGAVNRSGDLITLPLTNTLTEYTLIIPNSAAATITDYSNLSIKFWGFDIAGNALVFEISEIYLELPTSTGAITYYGAVSRGITFTKAVSGVVSNKKTSVAEVSLASHGTPSERTNHTIIVRARTTSGSTGVIKAALYEGTTLRSGAAPLVTLLLTTYFVDYALVIPDAAAATITSYSNLSIKFWGHDSDGNALVFAIAKVYLELPPP